MLCLPKKGPVFMKHFIKTYKHIWILSYAFLYIPWFLYLEKTVQSGYHIMHIRLDDYIPFVEYFIVPYLLWFLYVSLAILFFFFTNKGDYYKLCSFLFIGMTISLIICTLFPNGTDFRPVIDPSRNVFSGIVAALYQTDTCTNVFPSIHVYNSIGVHLAIRNSEQLKNKPYLRSGSFVLMVLICLATVFLKQHSVIDGVGSVILAYPIYYLIYGNNPVYNRKKVSQKALS